MKLPGEVVALSSESAEKGCGGEGGCWETNSQFFSKGLLWEEGSVRTGSLMGPRD